MAMITIMKQNVASPEAMELYDVTFNGTVIKTVVTNKASKVADWINTHNRQSPSSLVVGLDVEWRPNTVPNSAPNPVATLQLCAAESCLIFQVLNADLIPRSLAQFLGDPARTFAGVGVEEDARKLERDYGLRVVSLVELSELARARFGRVVRKGVGLMEMAAQSGLEFDKPKAVTMSRWDNPRLSLAQVKYACLDAYVSFKVAQEMDASQYAEAMRQLRWNLDFVGP